MRYAVDYATGPADLSSIKHELQGGTTVRHPQASYRFSVPQLNARLDEPMA